MAAYDKGDAVRFKATFTDVDGAAADPATITLEVKNPAGTISTYVYGTDPITRESTGVYHYDKTIDQTGIWYYRWVGTGTGSQVAEESSITVRSSQF